MSASPKRSTKPQRISFSFSDPEKIGSSGKAKYHYGHVVTVPFSRQDPVQTAAFQFFHQFTNTVEAKKSFGIQTYSELLSKSNAAGQKPAAYLRTLVIQNRLNFDQPSLEERVQQTRQRLGLDRLRTAPFRASGIDIEDPPEQIRALIEQYAPDASRVYDPYAGTANVAIVAGQAGLRAFYSEIDPVLQFLAQVKIEILSRNESARSALATELRSVKKQLSSKTRALEAPADVLAAWQKADCRPPFDDPGIAFMLKLRTLIDRKSESDVLLGRCLAAASVETLSRFMAEEDTSVSQSVGQDGAAQVRNILGQEISTLISYFREQPSLVEVPELVSFDAEKVGEHRPLGIDLVITNPPAFTMEELPDKREVRCFLRIPFMAGRAATAGGNQEDEARKAAELITTNMNRKERLLSPYANAIESVELVKTLRRLLLKHNDSGETAAAVAAAAYFLKIARVTEAVAGQMAERSTFILDLRDSVKIAGLPLENEVILSNLLELFGFVPGTNLLVDSASRGGDSVDRRIVVFHRHPATTRKHAKARSGKSAGKPKDHQTRKRSGRK
jgi:hypothetical protein